ncbi:Aldolase [Lachnellula suecica]|uniref:Aldolase n=1 Tax=Lachnellula suecica TaxID=602035 RepID=A0A8T9CF70_9HELO|nr:Aldolase [Lachnellula suecica]
MATVEVLTAPASPSFSLDQENLQSSNSHIESSIKTIPRFSGAENDFRSDFVTVPTAEMLNAPQILSLADNWEEDPTSTELQNYMSQLTGQPAALLVLSGTAANQISLRTALGAPPHSVLVDHRSHIVTMEAGAVSSITGTNGHHLTVIDVQNNATLTTADYDCPTRLICLENTLNGTILPLSDVKAISAWARSQNPPIHLHLDGARLWQAVAAGAGSLQDYCQAFDSVALCFAKGLGAPLGSVIVGSQAFIKRARLMRRLFGGGMRQSAIIAAPARVAVEETFMKGRLTETHEKARRIGEAWESLGGQLVHPTETNMVWLNLDEANLSKEEFWKIAADEGIKVMMKGRLVIHYQISEAAIQQLILVFKRVLGKRGQARSNGHVTNGVKRKIDALG